MINVVFVCYGNTCRSPMAEYIFKYLVKQNGLESNFNISSAGVAAFDKRLMSTYTKEQLDLHNISYNKHLSTLFTIDIYNNSDYIIVMDQYNAQDIKQICKLSNKDNTKISKLLDYADTDFIVKNKLLRRNVQDPYGTNNYDITYKHVYQGCKDLLQFLRNKYHL